ncbi:hypothetical protein [Polaromonas sp. CF318]|uniref:hypothetical protein n=1 Tax=Polaromonas sp. CF318 TaxID=1144318 RepID=UPI0009DA9C69|nr:hypothetical protein [Polaromonas sp. CF318]
MKYFIPAAENPEQAERVYEAIAKFNSAPLSGARICALTWPHNGIMMSCEIGSQAPSYYGTGSESVVAIFDCGNLYKICTENRGVLRGEAILAGKGDETPPTYFVEGGA